MKQLLLLMILVFSFNIFAESKKIDASESKATEKAKTTESVTKTELTKTAEQEIILESKFVGDKEQPAVSYFIPWKGNETPDKLRWNMEEKHDQALEIIDRDVLLNSIAIYNDMNLENTTSSQTSTVLETKASTDQQN